MITGVARNTGQLEWLDSLEAFENQEAKPGPNASIVKLSAEQQQVVDGVSDWYGADHFGDTDHVSLTGYAGTGKTTVLSHAARQMKEEFQELRTKGIAFMTLTGKASTVLQKKLSQSGVGRWPDSVSTIHQALYRLQGYDETWRPQFARDEDKVDGLSQRLIFVDEASMVTESVFRDLQKFNRPILFSGDPGQLPPVDSGEEASLLQDPEFHLTEIHRQAWENPIVRLADSIRRGEGLALSGSHDEVALLQGRSGIAAMTEFFRNHALVNNAIVLCGTNFTRVNYNQRIRAMHGFVTKEDKGNRPLPGEKVVCLRNNHQLGVMNGECARVVDVVTDPDVKNLYKITFVTDDNPTEKTTYCLKQAFNAVNANQMHHLADTDEDVKEDLKTLGAPPNTRVDLFDFGYVLSVHKSQGSEWERVFLCVERAAQKWDEFRRWLYTGVTRSSKYLTVHEV